MAGAAAAMMSKTGAISYVGGLEIPPIVNAGTEFGNGAKSINPNIKFFVNYTGDFDDVAKSKEATLAAIAQGADIHYHILNLGLRGMEQAAKEKGTTSSAATPTAAAPTRCTSATASPASAT